MAMQNHLFTKRESIQNIYSGNVAHDSNMHRNKK